MRWRPIYQALNAARRPSRSENKRLRWEYQCSVCKVYYPRKSVEVDHNPPVGSLRCAEDLPGFVTRLFTEADGLRVVCEQCHASITAAQRQERT